MYMYIIWLIFLKINFDYLSLVTQKKILKKSL